MRAWEWALLVGMLALFAAQALFSSPQKSAAFDEEYHLAAGYAYLKTGDFRMSRSHPPLINALSALPLLGRSAVTLPLDHPSWEAADYFIFSDVFIWQAGNDAQAMLVAARVPIVALGVLLAAAVFWWARQWAGAVGGWAALSLATFDPNLLANSRLVTTDLGLTLFFFVAVWLLWRWLQHPTTPNLILAGIVAGLASASKFTGLMIWPVFAALVFVYPRDGVRRRERLLALVGMGLAGYAALWAVFGFDVGPVPGSGLEIPIAAPFYPYSVWDTFTVIEDQPKTAYLLGQTSPRGWWYYFPVALAVKTPLPLLLLALGGLIVVARDSGWRRSAPLWLPPALFLALSMTGRITIGYRHSLPLVPFLIVLAGIAAQKMWREGRQRGAWRVALVALLAWQAIDVLRLLPHQEAYFNQLAGGPEGGGRVLADSNLDWGQDLILLRRLLQERGIDQPYLAYFGTALPEAYGLSYKPLPAFLRFTAGPEVDAYNPYTPLPGWYAISRSSLRLGLLHQNVDIYDYFRDKEPVARAGYSINLYEVSYAPDTAVERTVVSGVSVADLTPEELEVSPGSRLVVKWTANGETTIVPAGRADEAPDPAQNIEADFEDAFTLVGADLEADAIAPGSPLQLTLTWRVGSAEVAQPSPATAAPLAAFVHLSGDDPADILAQHDGWGAALTGLERGDLIRQRVTLQVPQESERDSYYIQVGLYSPQSGRRLAVSDRNESYVRLGPFERAENP